MTTFGATGSATFNIHLEDYPDRKRKFSKRELVVEKDEIANVTIKMTADDLVGLATLTSEPAYVYLVCEAATFAGTSETILPLSLTPGYIFIQTDKPVYTPDQTVFMRVMALDEDFKPTSWPLQIDVLNPKGLAVSRQTADGSDVIFRDSLRIPDYPVYGNWTVRAKYANGLDEKGEAVCRIPVSELRLPVESVWFPNGGKLHMEAAVTEYASGKVERSRDSSVVFAESPYTIKFTRSSRRFKPGLTYSLKIGDAFLPIPALTSPDGEDVYRTDDKGHLVIEFLIASDVKRLQFKDRRDADLEVGEYVTVTTQYTSSEDLKVVNLLTRTHNLGSNSTVFYFPLTALMSPGARIVAFSIRGHERGSEVIADSVWLDMKHTCYGEIKLTLSDDSPPIFRPGDIGSLTVDGLPFMRVGMLAVDQAVYLLNRKSLTRQSGGQDGGNGLFEVSLEDDMLPVTDDDVPVRSNFPESWWFDDFTLGATGKIELDFALPDSITTWVLQAVGLSPGAGLCVAPPINLTTFRPFFVHVDLPYSAVRLEQLEVRVTVYNYMERALSHIEFIVWKGEGICYDTGAPGKNSDALEVNVEPNDATSVYFPIVPLEMGRFPGEGLEKIHTVSVLLDPSGKRFVRDRRGNQTFSLSSDLLGPTVRGIVDGVEEMLRLPTGCGEQNLIYLGPNVYVMRYLRAVGRLTSAVEKKARAFVRQGLMRQMTFRKDDGSFGTWPHAASSTWLTAFAMKILCQTNHFVPVDMNATCVALDWLRTRQRTDGSFIEDVWVTHREMLDSSDMIDKAVRYLEHRLEDTQRPLATAITSYALALAGSVWAKEFNIKLMDMALTTPDGLKYWSYASEDDFGETEKPYCLIFRTQDTVIGLQALSEYSIKSFSAILDMTCHVRSEVDDNFRKTFSLTREDALVLKSVQEISHKKKQCVKFRAKQNHVAENLQPAKVQVYDYYNPVVVVKILDRDLEKAGFERLLGVVETTVHQAGRQQVAAGDKVVLLKRASCVCPRVRVGASYLLMMQAPKRFKDVDGNQVYVFLLDKKTVVTEFHDPKDDTITKRQKRQARKLARTVRRLTRRGCRANRSKVNRKGKRRVKASRKGKMARALRRRHRKNPKN
nr:hypothetical protein BaRGS_001825 [Batillaria attramentaria]